MRMLTTQAYIRLNSQKPALNIEEFCLEWIPKLYGIHPDDRLYRKACIREMVRLMQGAVKPSSVDKNWDFLEPDKGYPSYVKPVLTLAHQQYRIMETLGVLPKFTLDYDDSE